MVLNEIPANKNDIDHGRQVKIFRILKQESNLKALLLKNLSIN